MRPYLTPMLAVSALLAALVAPRLLAASTAVPAAPPETPADPEAPADPSTPILASDAPQLHVRLDRSAALAGDVVRAELTLVAPEVTDEAPALPTDVVLVVDRSGSMNGGKIAEARSAAESLIGALGPDDRVSLVSFASDVTVDLALSPVGPASYTSVRRLRSGGGTELQAGIDVGLSQIQEPTPGRNRRVIVLTDGRPNTQAGVVERGQRAATLEAPLTTVGIGTDYDPVLLQQLADAGTGNHYWASPGSPLDAVFAAEFQSSRTAVTRTTALSWRGPDGVQVVDWGGLPSDGASVALGQLFAGQRRSVWVTLRVDPASSGDLDLGRFELTWTGRDGLPGAQVAAAGSVGVTRDTRVVAQNVDKEGWSKSVVNDEYNQVLSKVTAAVGRGDRQAAVDELSAYQARNFAMNEVVQSAAVTDNLAEAARLQQQVEQGTVERSGLVDLSTRAYQGRRNGASAGSFGSYGSVRPRPR
ncbi:MAG: VWA domain-containing protein [Myxococcales bacterium]|nr:VWA domain-containing protein [Myxococcales bacterium]